MARFGPIGVPGRRQAAAIVEGDVRKLHPLFADVGVAGGVGRRTSSTRCFRSPLPRMAYRPRCRATDGPPTVDFSFAMAIPAGKVFHPVK